MSDYSDNEYEVEAIVGMQKDEYGRKEYQVKWVGYDISEATWEQCAEFDRDHKDLVTQYKRKMKSDRKLAEKGKSKQSIRKAVPVRSKRKIDITKSAVNNNKRRKRAKSESGNDSDTSMPGLEKVRTPSPTPPKEDTPICTSESEVDAEENDGAKKTSNVVNKPAQKTPTQAEDTENCESPVAATNRRRIKETPKRANTPGVKSPKLKNEKSKKSVIIRIDPTIEEPIILSDDPEPETVCQPDITDDFPAHWFPPQKSTNKSRQNTVDPDSDYEVPNKGPILNSNKSRKSKQVVKNKIVQNESEEESDSAQSSDGEYVVEKIIKAKNLKDPKKRKYQVKWLGYDDPTWEPAECIETDDPVLKKLLTEFTLRSTEELNKKRRANYRTNVPVPPAPRIPLDCVEILLQRRRKFSKNARIVDQVDFWCVWQIKDMVPVCDMVLKKAWFTDVASKMTSAQLVHFETIKNEYLRVKTKKKQRKAPAQAEPIFKQYMHQPAASTSNPTPFAKNSPYHIFKHVEAPYNLPTSEKEVWVQCVENAQKLLVEPSQDTIDKSIRLLERANTKCSTSFVQECLEKALKFKKDPLGGVKNITATAFNETTIYDNVDPIALSNITHILRCKLPPSQKIAGERIAIDKASAALRVMQLPERDVHLPSGPHRILGINTLRVKAKQKYREVSRLIHPDKSCHPEASKAFAALEYSHRIIKDWLEQLEALTPRSK